MTTPRVTNTNDQAASRAPLKSTRILEETLARPEIKKQFNVVNSIGTKLAKISGTLLFLGQYQVDNQS